eukprot:gnl/TRDRNA2_/TRDRNA2_43519_c0_seq1.p1 gnl/TRDRNA2_/TRDRNA2_43519_c0~~gnl/TRDRNA2_/TRDRNA2_43519_c0_seq1.p1  ORF type:complete len:305 (+),score=102.40 gnl/TRDRNA2_/TRDRNA2_43519_c0_seq1:68-982(+)
MSPFLLALALGPVAAVGVVNSLTASQQVAYERQLAEQDDERFLAAQWGALEGELQLLSRALNDMDASSREISSLQIGAAPKKENRTKKAAAPVKAVNQTKAEAAKSVADGIMAKLRGSDKSIASQVALAPMLEMLKGLYEDQKKRITELNKREEANKKRYEKQEADYKKSIAQIEKRFKDHKISEGFYHNETHDAEHAFDYWKHCRERNHRQFHTSLKLTHATMEKEKMMMKAYEEALKTPKPTKAGARNFAKIAAEVGPMPDVEFLQTKEILKFCSSSLSEVHSALGELRKATKGHRVLLRRK